MLQHYFTCIENNFLEYIMKNIKKAAQIKILLCIVRFTNGFHRKEAMLSTSFIAQYTGLSKRGILRELAELEEMGVIHRRTDKSRNIKVLSLNPGILGQPDMETTALCDMQTTTPADQTVTSPTDTDDIQQIKNNKYNHTNIKESEIPLDSYSENLQNSLKSWYEAHDMDMKQMEALLRITDKYIKLYDEDAVAEVIDQCLSEGRNGVYFDRLHGQKRVNEQSRELERLTWESVS